jgi:hypothetical protein
MAVIDAKSVFMERRRQLAIREKCCPASDASKGCPARKATASDMVLVEEAGRIDRAATRLQGRSEELLEAALGLLADINARLAEKKS